MLDQLHLENLICIDIETVPAWPDFVTMPDELKELYLKKSTRLKQEGETEEEQFFNHAGIYAEFGKVICIVLGIFRKEKNGYVFRMKTISGDDERNVLMEFSELLGKHYNKADRFQFCGHNIREFDIPYLSRRYLVNRLPLPALLDISGKKPWEVNMIDTLQLWRFGDVKHYTSLKLLALILGIDSPKDDIEGKDVGRVYWKEKDLPRIIQYCRRDVVTVAQLILRFKGMPLLPPDQIVIAGD
ncbi:MAG: ribonuclease H-like domain-containing protein [Chitinophagales bacterium]|nr:ribonuclease H-like domain-containing protein [Chitinophagales bacterium]